jgi:vacuolar-type H+-ATPase subunit E/Vma4
VVAKERKMTTSNIQQHYYRFKRKAQSGGKKANSSTRRTVNKVQGRALGAAATAVNKIPAKQRKQVAKGVSAAGKRVQTASVVGKDVREDLSQVLEDMFASINEVLTEARKNPQFKKIEKKLVSRFKH